MKQKAIKSIDWDGKKITKPGLYAGVPIGLYHSAQICDGDSVSSSGLRKLFSESPADFYDEWAGNPNRAPDEDKTHFAIGRAVHHLMLGEPFFSKLFCIQPAEYEADQGEMKTWSNNAKACREWQAQRAKEGKAVLTLDSFESIRGMAEALSAHPLVRAGALNGLIERSGFFKDKATGLWVKIRPDAIPTDSGDYTDIKTTTSVLWNDLRKTIFERGYHQQLALIRTGVRELGFPFTSASLVFVKKKRPFSVRVVTLKDNTLDQGERANRVALDAMADCLKKKHWPGPGGDREDAQPIELPEYAEKQIEDRLRYGIPT
jgi:hypothetical protein